MGVGPDDLQWSLPTGMTVNLIGEGRQWNRRQRPQAELWEVQTVDEETLLPPVEVQPSDRSPAMWGFSILFF